MDLSSPNGVEYECLSRRDKAEYAEAWKSDGVNVGRYGAKHKEKFRRSEKHPSASPSVQTATHCESSQSGLKSHHYYHKVGLSSLPKQGRHRRGREPGNSVVWPNRRQGFRKLSFYNYSELIIKNYLNLTITGGLENVSVSVTPRCWIFAVATELTRHS